MSSAMYDSISHVASTGDMAALAWEIQQKGGHNRRDVEKVYEKVIESAVRGTTENVSIVCWVCLILSAARGKE